MADASTSGATVAPGGRPAATSSQTDVETHRCSYTWSINNFANIAMRPGETLVSPTFPAADGDGRIAWRLSLCPGGESDASRDNMALELTLVSGGETEVTAECSVWVLDAAGIGVVLEDGARCTFPQKSRDDRPKWRPRFPARSELTYAAHGLLPDGRLTIRCELAARTAVSRAASLGRLHRGCTNLRTVTVNYEWTINNFSFLRDKWGTSLVSPEFGNEADPETRWKLKLFPNGRVVKKRACKYVQVFLKTASRNETDVTAQFQIWLVNSAKKPASSTDEPVTFPKGKMSGHGFNNFMERKDLFDNYRGKKYLVGDALVLGCRITYFSKNVKRAKSVARDAGEEAAAAVASGARETMAAARRALLSDTLSRGKEDGAAISDADRDALARLLWSVYAAIGQELLDTAGMLLNVVNAYDLVRFGVVCERALCSRIATDNAEDMLRLADEYDAGRLRTEASEFIDAHRRPTAMETESVASTSTARM